jgi:hypothetical protein
MRLVAISVYDVAIIVFAVACIPAVAGSVAGIPIAASAAVVGGFPVVTNITAVAVVYTVVSIPFYSLTVAIVGDPFVADLLLFVASVRDMVEENSQINKVELFED